MMLTTVKNYVVHMVFPIYPVLELPYLFPKYLIEYQNVKKVKSK